MSQNHPRNRAPSRGSTASIHSNTTQQNLEQSFVGPHAGYTEQWSTSAAGQPQSMMPVGHQMSNGDIILRTASQMHNGQPFSMDASMQSSVGHTMPYAQHAALGHPGLPADSFGTNASYTDPDSQMMDRDDHGDGDSLASLPPNLKPSSNKTSANNELEMRQLFQANKHRGLQDVATELHGNERGPNSERTRQVFAMLWYDCAALLSAHEANRSRINQTCSKGKGSVPRGRVYANYASRCATERITVLNPASFGKLVRVLFPGLKTRRLGVRGESKYHYVNFTLADEQLDTNENHIQPSIFFQETTNASRKFT
jgi:regulatory factor X, other